MRKTTAILDPAPQPKPRGTKTFRPSHEAQGLLDWAEQSTGKTQSQLINECILLALGPARKGKDK